MEGKKDLRVDKRKAEQFGRMTGVITVIRKGERLSMAKYMQMFKRLDGKVDTETKGLKSIEQGNDKLINSLGISKSI